MGLMVHSLFALPSTEKRDFYVYLLNYGWTEQLTEELTRNIPKMADVASRHGAVVIHGTPGSHFADEVLSWHRVNGRDATDLLPAILVTTKHPKEFREHCWSEAELQDRLLIIPLRKVCKSPSDVVPLIERLFSDIQEKRILSQFDIAEQMSAGRNKATLDALILKPKRKGEGISLERIIKFFTAKNDAKKDHDNPSPGGKVAMSASAAPVQVFISYTHDSDAHKKRVTALVEDLRTNGIDAHFDRDVHGTPSEGWPRWMERQIASADYVLVICSETYLRRYELRDLPGKGKGAIWEGAIIRQEFYDGTGENKKFAAVLFDTSDEAFKPQPLRPHTHYVYPSGRTKLLRWLTNQPAYKPIPLGRVPVLPPDP